MGKTGMMKGKSGWGPLGAVREKREAAPEPGDSVWQVKTAKDRLGSPLSRVGSILAMFQSLENVVNIFDV